VAPSYLAWLDHSERDRRRALDAVQALREPGTVDELGLGIIWEPLADLLFPGTSTLQTRARYFLIIPWVYRDLERRRAMPRDVGAAARELELGLIGPLAESDDPQGVIGVQARRSLKRLPSEIYWRGLEQWGIRFFNGSRDQYHRWMAGPRVTGRIAGVEDEVEVRSAWHAGLPLRPDDFPQPTGLTLSSMEAAYLQDRIRHRFPDSVLAWLIERGTPSSVRFAWLHPEFASLSPEQQVQVGHAEAFSNVMRGAQLLYNLMLSEALGSQDDLVEFYQQELTAWTESELAFTGLARWDVLDFWRLVAWAGARTRHVTIAFIDQWIDAVRRAQGAITDDRQARQLIRNREFGMKRQRARLANPAALARWGGAAAVAPIDYRWTNVQQIATDIIQGLQNDA
jgi:hypothetical protein